MKRVIFYHDDADGRCAAAIAARFARPVMETVYVPRRHPQGPDFPAGAENPGEVWVLDYSFEEADMRRLIEMAPVDRFFWIDHHETTLRDLRGRVDKSDRWTIDEERTHKRLTP